MPSRTEAVIGEIWAELLRLDKISPQDDFFEMGGDSITLMTMLFRTGDVFDVEIRPATVMDAPTLREFCRAIDEMRQGVPSAPGAEPCAITPRARTGDLPASFIQEQIVGAELAGLYDPDKVKSHCLDLCCRIRGAIDAAALGEALRETVRRHEILRTSYVVADGTIFQHVNEAPQAVLRVEDLGSLSQGDRERETERILRGIAAHSFSFFRDRLMISATLVTGEDEHVLAVIIDHVAADGLSMTILRDELFRLYRAFSRREPPPSADLPIQYADFASWEREYFSGDRLEKRLAYWRGLARKPLDTTLPTDYVPAALSYAGDTVSVTTTPELKSDLIRLSRSRGVTLFTALFAAFISLIHAFSGRRYNFFCMPVANRPRRDTRSVIGCFMNFQFVHVDLSGNPTFLELVERLDETLFDAYDNYVPFHFITRQIPPQGPVVDFQLLNAWDEGVAEAEPGAPSFLPFKLPQPQFALFPIAVRLSDASETITGQFKYQTAAYGRDTIVNLANDYLALLDAVTREPDMRLHDMGIKPHGGATRETGQH
ncbi:MAG: condensation domain-containing protein [Acidobacteriota bacterium]|nr:condensation domain-containing protein [Acidobacteriota bacterium]